MNHILINMEGLHEIEAALGKAKDKSKLVLRKAINDTAKEVEKRMAKKAAKRYARHDKGVKPYKAVTTITKAKTSNLSSTIVVRDKISDLYDFTLNDRTHYPGSKGAPRWIKAKQLSESRIQGIAARKGSGGDQYKAFVVQYDSGHIALAQRVPGSHMRDNPDKEAIKSLYATSKPRSEEFVFKTDIEDDVNELLMKSIQEQIARFL